MFIQVAIASGAIYCGYSRISDYKHHPTDVLAGLILGFVVGLIVFYYVLMKSGLSLLRVKDSSSMESVVSRATTDYGTAGVTSTDVYNLGNDDKV